MTERLHFHFALSCIGEGNSNPLQCSCLENPRDGRAWWAAVCGVSQSWTQLEQLSGSSSNEHILLHQIQWYVLSQYVHIYGVGNSNSLQYSCLGNPMAAIVQGVANSWTRLSTRAHTHTHTHTHRFLARSSGHPLKQNQMLEHHTEVSDGSTWYSWEYRCYKADKVSTSYSLWFRVERKQKWVTSSPCTHAINNCDRQDILGDFRVASGRPDQSRGVGFLERMMLSGVQRMSQ